MNVLLVGSDSRATVSAAEAKSFGKASQVGGQRSDTIIVLHIDPKSSQASMLSIPRDLYVQIAGTNTKFRINSAFEKGPQRLVQTVQESLGIQIDHYVEVDFNGFRGVVSAIGGVTIYSPAKARDKLSGLNIANPGCVTLDGNQALSYVRSRHYEYFESGRWRSDPTGDLGRIQRQQDFIRRVLKKAAQKAKRNPIAINSLIGTGVQNATIDNTLSPSRLAKIAFHFKSLQPDAVQMLTLPTVPANIGGAAVLLAQQPDAKDVIDRFLGRNQPVAQPGVKAPPNVVPNSVRVRVLNGSGATGQGGDVAKTLSQAGYNVAGVGPARNYNFTNSVLTYGRGQHDKALLLQSQVKGNVDVVEDVTLQGIDLVFTTGSQFGGIVPLSTGTPASTTPTTVAPTKTKPAAPTTTLPAAQQC